MLDPFAGWRSIDISVPVAPGIPAWPGDPAMSSEVFSATADGDVCNLSVLHLSAHTGTHVDAPWHFVDDGARLDQVGLSQWFGPALVVRIPDERTEIDVCDLEPLNLPRDVERLLFRTNNSLRWHPLPMEFDIDFVALTPAAADWIVARGIRLVGIDYLSIEGWTDTENQVHRTLLGAGVLVLEGINLTGVDAGEYYLMCLPIHLQAADGAPARAVLMQPQPQPQPPYEIGRA